MAPRRRRRPLSTSNSSRISSNIGTSARVAGAHHVGGVVLAREDGVDVRVGHPLVAVDDAVVHLVAHDLPAAIDFHQARLHEPIDVRIEAAQAGGELVREHVHGALGEIHRRAALVGLLVERAALLHVVRHVGDVHARASSGRSAAARCVMASSKSRACSPSIVTVVTARKSVRPLDVAARAPRRRWRCASSTASGGCASGMPYLRMMICVSTPGSSMRPEHLDDAPDRPARGRRPPRDRRRPPCRRARPTTTPRSALDVGRRRRRSNGTT